MNCPGCSRPGGTGEFFSLTPAEVAQVVAAAVAEAGGRLPVISGCGYSSSAFSNPEQTTVTIDASNTPGFFYDFSTRFPRLRPGVDVANPATFGFVSGTSEVRIRPQTVDNSFTNAKGFAEWTVTPIVTLKAGADWRKFDYRSTERRRLSGETVVQTLTPAQLAAATTVFSGFDKGLDMPDATITSWVVPDLARFTELYGVFTSPLYATGGVEAATARGSFVTVREKDLGIWGMGAFNLADAGLPVRGDVGLRYVDTKQRSGGNLSVSGGNRSFSSGNPDLLPTESDNLDASIEWYPTRGEIYAVAAFQKDIGTFVQTLSVGVPFADLGLLASLLTGTTASPDDIFIVSQPVNSSGGKLRGFEVNVQQPFSFLPGFLANFGVLANYTFVDSKIRYLTSANGSAFVTEPLVGLSRHAANGTLYYETEKFAIRGSVAYRSRYLTAVLGTEGNSYNGTNSTVNVDAQISYNVTDNFKLSLEAINLTDQVNDQFVDETNRLNVLTHSGRQFNFGGRLSF